VVESLRATKLDATFVHVKGHQDTKIPVAELPLLAQLNVEADRHAGEFRNQFGDYCPVIPLSPTRPVSLELSGRSIHCGFKQAIRDSIHGNHLLEAMQLRYEWPDGTLELVDWDTHRQALQSQQQCQTHFLKLCHNILPTGNVVGRYGQGLPSHCQLFRTPEEDFHHVLCCPHQSPQTWRSEFLSSLRKKCHAIATDQALTDILLTGVESWLSATTPDFLAIPTSYHHII
jgi:hypothetical protein